MRHARHCGSGHASEIAPFILAMAGGQRSGSGGPWGWGGFGPGSGFGPQRGGHRGGRRSRGDVRAAILLLLEEQPRNGYGLMQEVEQRSSGAWRPSPGAVYLADPEYDALVREGRAGTRPPAGDCGRSAAARRCGRQA